MKSLKLINGVVIFPLSFLSFFDLTIVMKAACCVTTSNVDVSVSISPQNWSYTQVYMVYMYKMLSFYLSNEICCEEQNNHLSSIGKYISTVTFDLISSLFLFPLNEFP